jgi:N-acetyl-gamma-glutamyl-phosphate reductase
VSKINVGIIGASGYTGAELARVLAGHPHAQLAMATASGDRVGQRLSDLFPSLEEVCELELEPLDVQAIADKCQVAVIALGHGNALQIVPPLLKRGVRVVDLGADFRLRDAGQYSQWYHLEHSEPEALREAVYGLPEWHRGAIEEARLVANPGCYPSSAILALGPLVERGLVRPGSVIIDSASGVSGAGRSSFGLGTHFSEVYGDFKAYSVASHRHTPEIEQGLRDADPSGVGAGLVTFTPHLLPVARGILSTCYFEPTAKAKALSAAEWGNFLKNRYAVDPFVRVAQAGRMPRLKDVVGSNYCDLGVAVDGRTGRVIVVSAIDNLLKGASGQAVQNINIMYGWPENTGLDATSPVP